MPIRLDYNLLNSVSHKALAEKMMEGFKHISGSGWEQRANYNRIWPLVHELYAIAYGPRAKLPEEFIGPLAFMFAGHAGRTRKGTRRRPYFHHILMVVYTAWVLDLPREIQLALINHDDVEDIPKNLGVSKKWVRMQLYRLIGSTSLGIVNNLTNKHHPDGKHAGQLEKMASIPHTHACAKLVDRICNLYDMRYDRPKGMGPAEIRQNCHNALELANAMPVPAPEPILALLHYCISLLVKENNLATA